MRRTTMGEPETIDLDLETWEDDGGSVAVEQE
jgi:hypothetical protein